VCQIHSHRNCQRVAADGCTGVALGLENDLDGAVLLLLKDVVAVGASSSGNVCVAKESTPNGWSFVSSGVMSSTPFLHVGMNHSQLDLLVEQGEHR
jgi:hypothetical protein